MINTLSRYIKLALKCFKVHHQVTRGFSPRSNVDEATRTQKKLGVRPEGTRYFRHKSTFIYLAVALPFLIAQADFTDEFDGPSLDPAWNTYNAQLFTPSISNGQLEIDLDDVACSNTESGCVWFNNDTAGMLYQTMTGDFTATTAVLARDQNNPALHITDDTQLAGLIVRDPSSAPGSENYVFNVVGMRFDVASIETKSTLNSSSSITPFTWPNTDAELRICREGSTFRLYARAIGGTTWTLMETFNRPDLPNTVQVGLISYTFHAYPENILAQFDYIRVISHIAGNDCTADSSSGNNPPTAPGNLNSPQQTDTSIELSWNAATDDSGVIDTYEIYRQDSGLIASISGSLLTYTDTSLTPDTQYTYWVTAVDLDASESAQSNALNVSTAPDSTGIVPLGNTTLPKGGCGEYDIPQGSGMVYNVGPTQMYTSISAVPMESLQPGDTIRIHWRQTPYQEKLLVGGQGTESNPIIITGVPNGNCELPIIEGNGATTRLGMNFPNQDRGVITVEGNNKPQWIYISNLEIRGGHPDNSFTDSNGQADTYRDNAAGIHVVRGENIHILGCKMHLNGNGLFVGSFTSPSCENSWCANQAYISKNILVEGCYVFDNAVNGSLLQHNIYTEALGIVFQYNHIGNVIAGANGNCIKDRSAGTIIRFNKVEGVRPLDLVEPEFGEDILYNAPEYDITAVYGNVIIKLPGVGNDRIVHYGGDNGDTTRYRKGTLYFYHNTVVARRNDSVIFGLETNDEVVDARNNIFFADPILYPDFYYIDGQGTANLSDNWTTNSIQNSQGGGGTVTATNTTTGNGPGFIDAANDDFSLDGTSPALGIAGPLVSTLAYYYPIDREYITDLTFQNRTDTDDLGALAGTVAPPPPTINMPVTLYEDAQLFAFSSGHATQTSSIASGEGVDGSDAIKYLNIQTNSFTRLDALDFTAAPLDISSLASNDYLMLSIDIGDVASPLTGVFLYFNDFPWNAAPSIQLPEIDNVAGFQTFILPIDSIHSALGNQLTLLLPSHGNWPIETLWLDNIQFVRTEDMHPIDAERLNLFGILNVNNASAQDEGDYDSDTFSNFEEFVRGTDATLKNDYPTPDQLSVNSSQYQYLFQLGGILEGVQSTIQSSINLNTWDDIATKDGTNPWVPLPGHTVSNPSSGMWQLEETIGSNTQFYRLKLERTVP